MGKESDEKKKKKDPSMCTIKGVEIFSTGKHNGDEFTEQDIDDILAAFKELDYRPALKVGHTKDQPGAPAFGWIANLSKEKSGERVVLKADFEDMHESVADAIRHRLYDRVSSEIYFNLERGKKVFRRALKAVALLGAEVPAVANLVPLHKMEFSVEGFGELKLCESKFEVSAEALLNAYAERVSALSNQITELKEIDMAKNAARIAELEAQVAEFKGKMDELRKKKGKSDEEMDDEEFKQLASQVKALSTQIAQLKADDDKDAEVEALRKELAESKAREEQAAQERKDLAERMNAIEAERRAAALGNKVSACKIPAFKQQLEALYSYALDNKQATAKLYSVKDGKTVAEEKNLVDIIDAVVEGINAQHEKLFKSLAYSGATVRDNGEIEESASKEVAKRVDEFKSKHPEVKSYEERLKAVLKADPELAARYKAEVSHGREQ